jgi:hypothetical protein
MPVCKMCRSAYALCAPHLVRCAPSLRKPGFRAYHCPLLTIVEDEGAFWTYKRVVATE